MSIGSFITNLLNSLLDGSFERMRVINQMNAAFKEYFMSGEIGRMCKFSIFQGKQENAHEMSSVWFRSGFKVSVENDINLRESEMTELANYIVGNQAFVRQLMAMGFDTLIVKGKTTGKSISYALKKFANLDHYYIR